MVVIASLVVWMGLVLFVGHRRHHAREQTAIRPQLLRDFLDHLFVADLADRAGCCVSLAGSGGVIVR